MTEIDERLSAAKLALAEAKAREQRALALLADTRQQLSKLQSVRESKRLQPLPRVLATRVTLAEDALIRTAAEAANVTPSALIRKTVVTELVDALREAVQLDPSGED